MRIFRAFTLAIMLLHFSLSFSEAGSITPEKLFNLSIEEFLNIEVVSVSKKPEESFTAPGTVYVISEEDINRYRFRTLQEALKYVPSVYLYDPQSWVWGGQRGFVSNFSQTLLLINGREINNIIAGEGFISKQFGTQNIKRIEVVASPASALYGANALAGIINVITKDADPRFEGIELSLDMGSHNTTVASLVLGKTIRDLSFKGSFRSYKSDEADFLNFVTGPVYSKGWPDSEYANPHITGYDNGAEATTINLQMDFKGLYTGINYYRNKESHGQEKLRWDYMDGLDKRRFTLLYTGFEGDVNKSTHIKAEYQYIRSYWWGSYDAGLWPGARLQAGNDAEVYNLPDSVTTSTGLTLQGRDEIESYYTSFAAYLIDQGILDPNNITPQEIERYFQHIYTNKASDANQRHRVDLMTTIELDRRSSIDIGATFDYTDIAGLAVTDAGMDNGASYEIPLDSSKKGCAYESKDFGVFGQFNHALIEDRLWLNLGMRYDHHEQYGGTINPRVGLVWQADDLNTIKLLYGEAFREPNIFELSSDPNLEPAKLKSYEVGFAHSFGQTARISLAGYHSKIDNFLASVGSLIGTGVGDVETQVVQGVEYQFDIKKGPITAFVNGAYVFNAEQEVLDPETGIFSTQELLGLPGKKMNIGVSCNFFKYYTLSFISGHVGAYEALSGDSEEPEPFEIKASHNIKLTLSVADVTLAGIPWDGFITVNNLTDRKNYEANIRRSGPYVFEQEGRSLIIGIRAIF